MPGPRKLIRFRPTGSATIRAIIQQTIVLPARAEALYAAYLDPIEHSRIAGRPVTVGAEAGAAFAAFDGAISGMTLAVVQDFKGVTDGWDNFYWTPWRQLLAGG